MLLLHTVDALRCALKNKASIGFVPTMGNLHAGHLALIKHAQTKTQTVVVSVFVNPLQFSIHEDFDQYPRTLNEDMALLSTAGVDILFAPSVSEIYPDFDGTHLHQVTMVTPSALANTLCGATRRGHFAGVLTVVLKLFNIVMPQIAVFGKKDFQQLVLVSEMVRQFNLPISILAGETVRDPSGLALSSRNRYLQADERDIAPVLYQTLSKMVQSVRQNQQMQTICATARQELHSAGFVVDYVEIRSATTLGAPDKHAPLVALLAAKLGNTRLIDNIDFIV